MKIREEYSVNKAWKSSLKRLFFDGDHTDNQKYYRDQFTTIEIEKPIIDTISPDFPMSLEDLKTINNYIVSGEGEDKVCHEWTKIYYHRIWDEPNSQIAHVINELKKDKISGRSLISIWDKNIDQAGRIAPCTLIIWFRKKFGSLEIHVHAHSSDAYKKLAMNMQEFVSLQYYVADQLELEVGRYIHIIDSCHIHESDKDEIFKMLTC